MPAETQRARGHRLAGWSQTLALNSTVMCLDFSPGLPRSAVTQDTAQEPSGVLPATWDSTDPPPSSTRLFYLAGPREAWDWPARPSMPLSGEENAVSHSILGLTWSCLSPTLLRGTVYPEHTLQTPQNWSVGTEPDAG